MDPAPNSAHPTSELFTVRDWLRYGVSRFEAAGLTYGHGTHNAVDEAAFLILSLLDLPIDDISPWLDCRLTGPERQRLYGAIDARVTRRQPAAYLVQRAYIGAHRFYVDDRVIIPRSFIGELLNRYQLPLAEAGSVNSVLELCTGSACLAILAALSLPQARITASDISPGALDVARINVAEYKLQDRITLLQSDLFAAIPQQRFDLIIANPPYVTQRAVSAFPPEYRAEPELAHLGGADGMDLVHRILEAAPRYLAPDGLLVVEIGEGREALEAARPDLAFLWLDTETSEGEVFALTAEELRAPAGRSKSARKPGAASLLHGKRKVKR